MNAPTVSVLMPCRNAEPWLDEALQSALGQAYAHLEVVAVDDASDDATPEILDRAARACAPRVKVAQNANQLGVAAARTRCLELAEGELICLLDADDVWLPGKIWRQVAALEARPEAAVVHTGFEVFDGITGEIFEWERPAVRREGDVLRELWVKGKFVAASSVMFRRSALTTRGVSFSDLGFRGYDDYFLLLALALDYQFAYVDATLVRYRRHGGSLTAHWAAENIHARRIAGLRTFASDLPALRERLGPAFLQGLAYHSLDAAAHELSVGHRRKAMVYTASAARLNPLVTAGALRSYVARRIASRQTHS